MRKVLWLVLGATLLVLLIGVAAQCPSTPTPTSAPAPTKAPEATKAPEPTKAAAPTPTTAPAPTPVTKPAPPAAVLEIVALPANPQIPGAITATMTYITDTVVGEKKATVAMGLTGLNNVPINVPVRVAVKPEDPKNPGKPKWTLTAPNGSKAALKDAAAEKTEFTPDIVGWYKVDVALTNDGGTGESASVQIFAGTFVGVTAGQCETCHPTKTAEWAKTGHANNLKEEIDLKPAHYSETCNRCHTTGWWLPPANNGGFNDVKAAANYQFPTFKQIEAGGNWDKMPAEVKNMAVVGCETCHGPAKEHVAAGAKVMASSMDDGVCNVCHNSSSRHMKGTDLANSKHSNAEAAAWTEPTGPARQACVRCHSGKGYVSFLAEPTNQAAWNNEAQTVGCSTCHDPHSEANAFQLRIVGKPVALPFEVKKDVGLSATCYECHNTRSSGDDFYAGKTTSTPHYSAAAELLSETGGVTYGQTVANSPHGAMVGAAPIPNPAAATNPTAAKFLFTPAGDEKGNVPGPCVTCHMWPTITDAKDPNYHKVGGHSFNTVSPDGKFDYTAACKQCHGDIKSFNLPAKADYDGNGKVEGVQDEVKGLLDVLWKALEAQGVKKSPAGYPYATLPRGADGKVDPKINNAWYNFRTVYGVMWGSDTGDGNQGAAAAVHNFKRSVMLLQLSYKDLTGQDVPGATLMK